MIKMDAKTIPVVLNQKLRNILNDKSIANNKLMTRQLKRVQKSLEMLQNLSEEEARDYIWLFYEVEDIIDKFNFDVARQRHRFGYEFLMNQPFFFNNPISCHVRIRKLNNFISKICCFPENHKNPKTPTISMTSSSTVWPIPTTLSPKRATLTRSFTTISHPHPQKKKLTYSYSYSNDHVLSDDHDHQSPNKVVAKVYNDLCVDLKPCVSYMTLFPKDLDIPVRRLLRLWSAEGFVERKPSSEDILQKHFEDLVDSGMIQITKYRSDNSPKKCRLVPAFRDYLLPKAQETGLFYNHHDLDHLEDVVGPYGVRRMIHPMGPATKAHTKSVLAHKFDLSLLRSYVSFNYPHKDIPAREVCPFLDRVIKSDFRLLTVLDLEGVYKPTLPSNLDHLYLLKYLGLRRTDLDDLPKSVGKLAHLETLDLKHTNIDNLPNSIWQLKRLCYLNLNNIRLTMPPGSSSTLLTLWGLVLDDKTPVNEVLGMLLNLRELGIKFQLSKTSQVVLLDWIAKLSNLRSLRLTSTDGSNALKIFLKPLATLINLSNLRLYGILERLPAAKEFPPTIKVLTLSISQLTEDPMETLGQLPCLNVLRLLSDSFMGRKLVCHRGGFKKLGVLKMWSLTELEEWDIEEEAMENLKELDIRSCHKLKDIPCKLLIKSRRLKRLILTSMPDDFVDQTEMTLSSSKIRFKRNECYLNSLTKQVTFVFNNMLEEEVALMHLSVS